MSAIAPMVNHGNIVGTLSLYRTDKVKFTDQEFRHLEIIAGQTAVALDRAPQGEDSEASLFDELTGLPNGYQLYLMFDQIAIDAQRYEYPLALLSYRVEGLAEIRRRYGHLSSNEVLRFLAQHLSNEVRETDILVRYAEDQFMTLHPKMNREKAEALKSRVQDDLDQHQMPIRQGIHISPRASIGIAAFPEEGTKLEDLLSISEWRLNDDQKLRSASKKPLRFPS
jgi:diguanylate cyclase (GGDEF)-like protein